MHRVSPLSPISGMSGNLIVHSSLDSGRVRLSRACSCTQVRGRCVPSAYTSGTRSGLGRWAGEQGAQHGGAGQARGGEGLELEPHAHP